MKKADQIDLDAPRKFYDPHPGFSGAAIPIPDAIRKVANSLAGRTLTLETALGRLRAVRIGQIELFPDGGYIGLRLGVEDGCCAEHFFRVIRFK